MTGVASLERLRVGYHEAGHVLVARQLGRSVQSVSLHLTGGATRGDPLASDASPDDVERALVAVLAGEFAERYAPDEAPAPPPWEETDGPWFSWGELAAMNDQQGRAPRPSDGEVVGHWEAKIGADAVARARALAEELVDREHAIGNLALLASELVSRAYLTRADIDQILEGARR